ncbi:MAG: hypothetical protein ABI867_02680 [Kofleriaceae bacterium]
MQQLLAATLTTVLGIGSVAAEPDPPPEGLASAPAADSASGVAVPVPESDHPIANALLVVPRTIAVFLLTGPRYAAAGIDDYLEGRSADVGMRTASSSGWRFGAEFTAETEVGPSIALRIGYRIAKHTTVDAYGGLFGARGQSGGLRVTVGKLTDLELRPTLDFDAGNDLDRAFIGRYEADELAVTPALSAKLGPVQLVASARVDRTRNLADDGDPRAMLVGFDETERAATEELAVVLDTRRRTHPWVSTATWSTGYYVRAAAAYIHGDASRTGSFSTPRATFEARRLFDLFHGDRVLTIGIRGEAVSADDLPFDRLPSLGGRDRMRAFARDELRDRSSSFAEVQYEWALGADSRGYVFVETGAVADTLTSIGANDVQVGFGGGVRVFTGKTTYLAGQLAGSDHGDLGFFFQLGAL